MNRVVRRAAVWLIALAGWAGGTTSTLATPAASSTVWRCGAEGRLYSDVPCPGGRTIDAADPRSAEQVAQGRKVLADDMRRAEAMRRDRLAREAHEAREERGARETRERAAQPRAAAGIKSAALREARMKPAPKETKAPLKTAKPPALKRPALPVQPAADETWRAVAPASPRTPG